VFGEEFPLVIVKDLVARSQLEIGIDELAAEVAARIAEPERGPMLA
jgi:hypothetical protein